MIYAGKIVGDLTFIVPTRHERGHTYWKAKCRCGSEKEYTEKHVDSGRTTSCGQCNYWKDHPLAYKSWDSMNQRCNNPNSPDYPRYGGRGIKVDPRWRRFIDFLDDMGDPPCDVETGDRYTLERKDVDGDYTPENCKWASRTQQSNNMRNNVMIKRQPYKRKVERYQE